MKRHAPATLRNREAICEVLNDELPALATVLEVASGSGEHVVYFAQELPHITWQPSDVSEEALASIMAYIAEFDGTNVRLPLVLDARAPDTWEMRGADAILCVNMVHIAPWEAAEGLFEGAARILDEAGQTVILYGPFFEDDIAPAQSNIDFDRSLRERDAAWGLRRAEDVDELACRHGFARAGRHEMPANNLMLVYRRD
ncbi:DUF938 domain-containing protein [Erythrobacter sp.]|jgi:hypothetical protein|uniref:DUF938 domain-containing protein n=1 Tax=Erythrobacter sp. TaxID=1042 RepID=UPI002E9EA1F4|nr:DUF938 domain-containing protein [Erythrobacter sp.]